MDWASVTKNVEHALTLTPEQLTEFLTSLADESEVEQINKLIKHSPSSKRFLATSAPGDIIDADLLCEGTVVGVWKIEHLIGRGGMGDVYYAVRADGLYQQKVALKLIQNIAKSRATLFESERKRLALMDHPGIARIIDGGTTEDDRPYMAMEYIDGVPITQYVELNSLSRDKRLALFRRVCDSVEHAHSKLVLHRDIKPENVLVGSDGLPRLIDFGIASDLETGSGVVGALSLATAAPEQLKGESVSVQTDVFSLGVLLYELLTGKKPARLADASMQVDKTTISDSDLLSIINRALALAPNQRYVSATSLSEDVLAFLECRSVAATNGGWHYATFKFIKRYPLANSLATIAILSLTLGLAASLKFANDASEQAQRAERELYRANWQFDRSEANMAAQQAYSDVLQRTFGGEEDVNRLSRLLLERWQEAFDAHGESPKTAAALSYAVGRNFYFRGDTVTALKVFDPWMEKRFGEPSLVALGEEVYAMMLSDAGRLDEAIVILRRLVEFYGDGSLTNNADASNYANRLARATRAPEDVERSVNLLEKRLASLEDPFERLFAFSQLAGMRMLQADFETATYAYSKTVEIFEQNPGFASYGRDIARFNLAGITLAWKRDMNKVQELVDAILTEDVPLKGESIQQARALMLSAILYSNEQAHEAALQRISDAIEMFERYGGENSSLHVLSIGIQSTLLAQAGQLDEANASMAALDNIVKNGTVNARTVKELRVLKIYNHMLAGNIGDEDSAWLKSGSAEKEAGANMVIFYFYRLLIDQGHAPVFWSSKHNA